ncbi:MAG: FeoB-associated Cys-rich membrane protein [Clostridia bacterium]|nr:FeoB-associated Cys-rich membrane protein [Clostridia bacterium]
MLEWLGKNIGTIVVLALLAAAVIGVIVSIVKKKRSGGSTCSCGCSSCAMGAGGSCPSAAKRGKTE